MSKSKEVLMVREESDISEQSDCIRSQFEEEQTISLLLTGGGVLTAALSVELLLASSLVCYNDHFLFVTALFFVVAAIAVGLGYFLNDFLITSKGNVAQVALTLMSAIVGFGLSFATVGLGVAFLACSVVLLLLLWGKCVMRSSHPMFVVVIAVTMLFSGIVACLVTESLKTPVLLGLSLLFLLVSLGLYVVVSKVFDFSVPEWGSIKESKEIEAELRVNYGPALSDGLMMGVVLALVSLSVSENHFSLFPLGVALVVGGLICLLQLLPNFKYELFLRSHASCFKPIPFMLFPLADSGSLGISVFIASVIVLCFSAMLLSSLTERVRLIGLSGFYVYGRHGFFFFVATAAGAIVAELVTNLTGSQLSREVLIFGLVIIVVEWLLVGSQPWGTTYDHAISLRGNNQDVEGEPPTKRKASWREGIEAVSEQYGLSARQREVLALLAQGRNAQYISGQLCITVATAKTHIYNVYTKLGVHTQQELLDIVEAVRMGLR